MVSRAARAVGITRTTPSVSRASRVAVAMASISGTTRSGFSASIRTRNCSGSVIEMTRAWWAIWWPGAFS
ncbi:Uncharacterised protein [Mycobacteroides abscessus subsp. abscessus]|nr:Uncharacterised protein [Mycobacteroides abscessus subsp. abscessus]